MYLGICLSLRVLLRASRQANASQVQGGRKSCQPWQAVSSNQPGRHRDLQVPAQPTDVGQTSLAVQTYSVDRTAISAPNAPACRASNPTAHSFIRVHVRSRLGHSSGHVDIQETHAVLSARDRDACETTGSETTSCERTRTRSGSGSCLHDIQLPAKERRPRAH